MKLLVIENKLKFEDVIKEEDKNTQRSSNIFNSNIRSSGDIPTNRRSSITRSESDVADSLRPNSCKNVVKIDKNQSCKEIDILDIIKKEPQRIKIKRKMLRNSKDYFRTLGTDNEIQKGNKLL